MMNDKWLIMEEIVKNKGEFKCSTQLFFHL